MKKILLLILKVLLGIIGLLVISISVILYKEAYIPYKQQEDLIKRTVEEFDTKLQSDADSIKMKYAIRLIERFYPMGRMQIDYRITNDSLSYLLGPVTDYITDKAMKNNCTCQEYLGHIYLYGIHVEKDSVKAFYWWNEAAKQGYIAAYNCLGIAYADGIGVPANVELARQWFMKAADAGSDDAKYNLVMGLGEDFQTIFK